MTLAKAFIALFLNQDILGPAASSSRCRYFQSRWTVQWAGSQSKLFLKLPLSGDFVTSTGIETKTAAYNQALSRSVWLTDCDPTWEARLLLSDIPFGSRLVNSTPISCIWEGEWATWCRKKAPSGYSNLHLKNLCMHAPGLASFSLFFWRYSMGTVLFICYPTTW